MTSHMRTRITQAAGWPDIPEIRAAAVTDLYVREAWPDWRYSTLAERVPDPCRIGLLLLKPDGVVSRRIRPVLDYLKENGFKVLGAHPVSLSRNGIRAIWGFDWLDYSAERLAFCDDLYTAAPAFVILVEDLKAAGEPLALSRLSVLKGSAFPEKRASHNLRTILGARERVLNFVHTSDCLRDAVRETGILFAASLRPAALLPMTPAEVLEAAALIESATIRHDLDPKAALARLPLDAALRRAIAEGRSVPYAALRELPIDADDPVARWDVVTLASRVIALDYIRESA